MMEGGIVQYGLGFKIFYKCIRSTKSSVNQLSRENIHSLLMFRGFL